MGVAVFDFDGTIYGGDSTVDFFLYAVYRKPLVLRYLPKQMKGFFLYTVNKIDKTKLKEYFFSFLSGINGKELAEDFWKINEKKIYEWYLLQKNESDIIISASPEFLLRPVCDRLGIQNLIASRVDEATGKFTGENCYGEEKAARLREEYGTIEVEKFYSDSESDLPLARIAKCSYFIRKGQIEKWMTEEGL